MSERGSIFSKLRLTPAQLRAVAEQRFDDARCLLASGQNARVNGAMYMGGFVIECLLKALLLERHPNLTGRIDPAKLSKSDREVLQLLYRHELDGMLVFLPEVQRKLSTISGQRGRPLWRDFLTVCEQWTVFARYSPRQANRSEGQRFLETVQEVRQWLKEL